MVSDILIPSSIHDNSFYTNNDTHGDLMKGIILAGGTGSRLFPLTKVTNKHLLPVGRKPMIFHPIEKLIEAGVKEILIVTGIEHMGHVVGLLGWLFHELPFHI